MWTDLRATPEGALTFNVNRPESKEPVDSDCGPIMSNGGDSIRNSISTAGLGFGWLDRDMCGELVDEDEEDVEEVGAKVGVCKWEWAEDDEDDDEEADEEEDDEAPTDPGPNPDPDPEWAVAELSPSEDTIDDLNLLFDADNFKFELKRNPDDDFGKR